MVVEERTFFGNLSLHTFELSLHAVFSPFLQKHSQNIRPRIRKKTKDIQLEVDEQVIVFYPLDSIYRFYVVFPAGKTSPFPDRAGFEELYSWTIPVRGRCWGRGCLPSGPIALPSSFVWSGIPFIVFFVARWSIFWSTALFCPLSRFRCGFNRNSYRTTSGTLWFRVRFTSYLVALLLSLTRPELFDEFLCTSDQRQ